VLAGDARSQQFLVSRVVDTEFCEQRAIVFADVRRGRADRTRRAQQTRHDVMHRELFHVSVGIVGDELALDHMRVLDDLRDIVDRADCDFGFFKELDVLGLRALCDERADDRIELLGVLYALGVIL